MGAERVDFGDLAAFVATPRVTSLALAPDASRLIAGVEVPDEHGTRYVSSLWSIDPAGVGAPVRLTRSEAGESSPRFLPDGSLVFVSARPDGGGDERADDAKLWALQAGGEATLLARHPGGVAGPVVAAESGVVVFSAARPLGAAGDGAEESRVREQRKITAITHTGMPIRHWDHELGATSTRLLVLRRDGGEGAEPLDLAPDACFELTDAAYDVDAAGATVVTTWVTRCRAGRTSTAVVAVDVASGRRRLLASGPGADCAGPRISPDGRRVAALRQSDGDYQTVTTQTLVVVDLGQPGDAPTGARLAEVGDGGGADAAGDGEDAGAGTAATIDVVLDDETWITEWCWAADSGSLFVAGDRHGRGVVWVVDPATGRSLRRVASDACYSQLCPSPDGVTLFALRSAVDSPPAPVALDVTAADQTARPLRSPTPEVVIPGTVEEIHAASPDGATVHAWLCLPPPSDVPAPLMTWIHGGPFASHNSWSWRWNPWTAVARGWAVLLPDPALSTGYGQGWLSRAWPHRAAQVWGDVEVALDTVLARSDLDEGRTACLGGSFGGYMTNWIAGHTDRFGAIVTHAGLWALDQQHATTDNAAWKTGLFGTVAEHPAWYADNSPHHFVDAIRTPMLVVHGNRDYRVPVSEALRLWWDLVSRFQGDPAELPHRFLQFTDENHWVLRPANAEVWYEAVFAFCDRHVPAVGAGPAGEDPAAATRR